MWCPGLVAPWHVGSSWTRVRTHVPCIGRWILNHCATREAREGLLFDMEGKIRGTHERRRHWRWEKGWIVGLSKETSLRRGSRHCLVPEKLADSHCSLLHQPTLLQFWGSGFLQPLLGKVFLLKCEAEVSSVFDQGRRDCLKGTKCWRKRKIRGKQFK